MSTHYLLHLLLYNLNFDEPISKESSLDFFFLVEEDLKYSLGNYRMNLPFFTSYGVKEA